MLMLKEEPGIFDVVRTIDEDLIKTLKSFNFRQSFIKWVLLFTLNFQVVLPALSIHHSSRNSLIKLRSDPDIKGIQI